MRKINKVISDRLQEKIQTRENNANPSVILWITRSETPLVSSNMLDKQDILDLSAGDISISVCHPRASLDDSHIYIAYLEDNKVKVIRSEAKTNIQAHMWESVIFPDYDADSVCVAFDGHMTKPTNNKVEFVTEKSPWVFWTSSGVCCGEKVGDPTSTVAIATSGCTDVTVVRAMGEDSFGFDFGLVVFFLVDGQIYYRQLIDGEWMDAELVNFGPANISWEKLSGFRTWDYRIGVQAKATDGSIYELFSQSMGIGKQNTDHVEVSDIKVTSELKNIQYIDSNKIIEHVELNDVKVITPYGGLYSLAEPMITSVYNKDNGKGDWGEVVDIVFDNYIDYKTLYENRSSITLVDTNGQVFTSYELSIDTTGKIITAKFDNFNYAGGECTLHYTPGTISSMGGTALSEKEFTFTPTNLDYSNMSVPEIIDVYNTNNEGTEIVMRFSESLIGDISGNEDKITVTIQEYNYVPNGSLVEVTKPVNAVAQYSSINQNIDFTTGELTNLQVNSDGIILEEEENV